MFVCLCWGLTSQSTIFQSYRDGATASWVINQYFRGVKCLAQGHNTAAVGFEPPTSRSRVRHSTTEPPRSPFYGIWTASSEFGTYRLCEQRRFRRDCAVSPEPPLLAHASSESRGTFRQKARSLAPLNGWACAVKICHDGMLEDTNSLDGAHIITWMGACMCMFWGITTKCIHYFLDKDSTNTIS